MGRKPSKKYCIGIVLTDPKNEGKKEEIISIRKTNPPRPWTKTVDFVKNPDFRIDRKSYQLAVDNIEIPRTVGIATDVSIGEYIRMYHGSTFDVDFIRPDEITTERLDGNDINFLVIYDLLESFHTDRTKGKRRYNNFLQVMSKATNVFPNWKYQKFIDSKLVYYDYFKNNNIPICPTYSLSPEQYREALSKVKVTGGTEEQVANELFDHIVSLRWGKFIAKPVYGQEKKSCKTFHPNEVHKERFGRYVRETMAKYPGIIFQKFITGFGETTECPEVRMYYIGDDYKFSMVATSGKMYTLYQEGGKPRGRSQNGRLKLNPKIKMENLYEIAQHVIAHLKKNICLLDDSRRPVTNLPLFVTRVDIGCMQDGEFNPWVNEVEFVPSFYIEDHTHLLDAAAGEQAVKIAKEFLGINVEQVKEVKMEMD